MKRNNSQNQLNNLIPFNSETGREAGKKGQPLSQLAKKRNREISKTAAMIADAAIKDEKTRNKLASLGITDEALRNNALIAAAVFHKAIRGNLPAVEKWEEWLDRSVNELKERP